MGKLTRLFTYALVFVSIGCGSYKLDESQETVRTQFAARNYNTAATMLEENLKKKIYQEKDMVLYFLESGTVNHFGKNYKKSITEFGNAEQAMDDKFTKKVSNAAKSMMLNDNQLAYDGEPFEDFYTNAFKALNFLHLNDLEGAQVEARRMAFKIENLEIKYKGMVEAYNKNKDQKSKKGFEDVKFNIQASPMSHYLSAVAFDKMGKYDNARIERDRFKSAVAEQARLYALPENNSKAVDRLASDESYNVLLVGFSGRTPRKIQEDIIVTDETSGLILRFSIPKLQKIASQVSSVRVKVNGTETNLYEIERMDEIVEEIFKKKRPIIYTRTFIRVLVKEIAANAAAKAAKKENELAGALMGIAGKAYTLGSEKADLRGWLTLPGRAHVNVLNLPAGTHTVLFEYLNASGAVISTESFETTVSGNANELKLIESLYWN